MYNVSCNIYLKNFFDTFSSKISQIVAFPRNLLFQSTFSACIPVAQWDSRPNSSLHFSLRYRRLCSVFRFSSSELESGCFRHVDRFVPPSLREMKASSLSPLPPSFILYRRITRKHDPLVSPKSTSAFLFICLLFLVHEEKCVHNLNLCK